MFNQKKTLQNHKCSTVSNFSCHTIVFKIWIHLITPSELLVCMSIFAHCALNIWSQICQISGVPGGNVGITQFLCYIMVCNEDVSDPCSV